jgi:hypothetical protein
MRQQLGLLPDSEVVFELDRDSVRIRKAPESRSRGRRLIERMRGTAGPGLSTDAIMKLTRG